MLNFKATYLYFHGLNQGLRLPFYVTIKWRIHFSYIHSRPKVSEWKLDRPAIVINIRLHGGWNDCTVRSRDLGSHVTTHPTATVNVAAIAENKGTHWRLCPFACCSAVSMHKTRLFMHVVKQDATQLLFTVLVCRMLQMQSTNCRNNNWFLENKNDKMFKNRKKQKSFCKPILNCYYEFNSLNIMHITSCWGLD